MAATLAATSMLMVWCVAAGLIALAFAVSRLHDRISETAAEHPPTAATAAGFQIEWNTDDFVPTLVLSHRLCDWAHPVNDGMTVEHIQALVNGHRITECVHRPNVYLAHAPRFWDDHDGGGS